MPQTVALVALVGNDVHVVGNRVVADTMVEVAVGNAVAVVGTAVVAVGNAIAVVGTAVVAVGNAKVSAA